MVDIPRPVRSRHTWTLAVSVLVAWLATFFFSIATFRVLNDHFDRISRGRQLAAYGELPFRDFFDPGYLLTVFTSATVWRVAGDRLLGEVLLGAAFFASGAALVLVLARRASGSWVTAWVATLLAVLAMPRAYDYDKFLFYPLGVLLLWRYADRMTLRSLVALGAGVVAAGLFRYDHGVILLGSAVPALLVLHVGQWRRLARHAAVFALAIASMALPFLLFIHVQAGLANAVDQVVTYAWSERSRFVLETPPISFDGFATIEPIGPAGSLVRVRWAPQVDEASRTSASLRYSLRNPVRDETDDRTYTFFVEDVSSENLRSIVSDQRIEDTSGIDRDEFSVPAEPLWTRLRRAIPLLRLRLHLSEDNANAFLYYLFLAVPLVAAFVVARMPSSGRAERARAVGLIALCLLLDVFILRPVEIRGGGMAGPLAVLASWIVGRIRRPVAGSTAAPAQARPNRRLLGAAVALVVAVTAWSESVTAEWEERVQPAFANPARTMDYVRELSASPPVPGLAPGRLAEMVVYVRSCTGPHDRVFTSWFVPELYFFTQRGFAGGMAVTFSAHWSEPRFERQILERLKSQSVPLAIIDIGRRDDFAAWYAPVWEYLMLHYETAGETDFGNPYSGGYQVLVAKDRVPVRLDPRWSLPCFA